MEFVNIEKSNYLSAKNMNNIYNNFLCITELLTNAGYESVEIIDNSITYNISPALILEKMNAVEKNITNIHSAIQWDREYYKEFTWSARTDNRKSEVDRWIDWQNKVYKTLKSSYQLTDINGNIITDINGDVITVFKGE